MRLSSEKAMEQAGVGVVQVDIDGRYLMANRPYCDLLGREENELIKTHIHDHAHPDDLAALIDGFSQVAETGKTAMLACRFLCSDGSYKWLQLSVAAGRDAEARPEYLLVVAHDATELKLREGTGSPAHDMRMLLDSAADGFYCVDRDGATTLCNASFRRMLGVTREEDVIGTDLHALIHHSYPDGSPYPEEECPVYKTLQSGRAAHVSDEVFFRLDGTSFPVEYRVRPIERGGEVQGAVCTFVDLTERKQAEARQELLNHELTHRMKNTLAMVQAIVGQSLRNAATPRDAIQAINHRLVALGNAHTALTRTRWGNASVMDVVESAIAAHHSQSGRIRLNGPRVELGSKTVLMITLALHELCTNAAKYGALSNDIGRVSLDWSVKGGASNAQFQLVWKEHDGPPVNAPKRSGFGSKLIAESIGADLNGKAALHFEPDGVRWTLEAPLTSIKT